MIALVTTVSAVPTSISVERVRAVVSSVLGDGVTQVTRLAGSVANQDFAVDLAHGPRVVLKAGPAVELAAEAWACGHLAHLGVPVPHVAAVDLDHAMLGSPFLILAFVEGGPSEDTDVARDAGKWFRRIHDVELDGWGPIVTAVNGEHAARGRHTSWRDAVEAGLAGVPDLVTAGVLDQELADRARALITVPEVLGYDGPGVLLHNDVKPAHLFGVVDGNRRRLSAIIDWGDASVGDPVAEIARLSMAGASVTAAFLDGYQTRPTRALIGKVTRYRILWNLSALSYEYRAGGDWFDAYRERIGVDTARLRRERS